MKRTALIRRSPLLKKTRLNPVSKKRSAQSRIYSKKREAFLAEHPICQLCNHRKATDIHHRKGRLSGNYLDETTWMALCRECHHGVHLRPSWARSVGLLA